MVVGFPDRKTKHGADLLLFFYTEVSYGAYSKGE